MLGVGIAFGILRGESLVGMFVSRQDQVGMRVIQILPEGAQFGMLRVLWQESTAEECVMSVSECTGRGMRGKVLLQPCFFRRALSATTQLFGATIGIEHNDVPRAEVVAVIAFSVIAGASIPIAKIAGRG